MERRLLQCVVALACIIPLAAGLAGIVRGASWLAGQQGSIPINLDSHFRYLSGIFLGLGLGFVSCISQIETKGARFTLLGLFVILGGLARLLSWWSLGPPSQGHQLGLAVELGAMPLLILWQRRVARASASEASPG